MSKRLWAVISLPFWGWLLDHLTDEVTPKPPHVVAIAAFFVVLGVFGLKWLRELVAKVVEHWPRPWLPQNPWRFRRWLAARPRVSILIVQPRSPEYASGLMNRCAISLTLCRGVPRSGRTTAILFDQAELILTQGDRRFVLRPHGLAEFLANPAAPGHSDVVMVDFVDPSFPRLLDASPNFVSDYKLELRGVRAEIAGRVPLYGRMPSVSWAIMRGAAWSQDNQPVWGTYLRA
jgi:hypothetical protein